MSAAITACTAMPIRRSRPVRAGSRRRGSGRPVAIACAATVLATAGSPPAQAQPWHFVPSVALDETLTNNVNLSPPDAARGDLVTVITPTLAFDEKSARTTLRGTVSLPVALYAKTGALNNKVYPLAYLLGDVDVYEKFFRVEGEASVSQQFSNPFG